MLTLGNPLYLLAALGIIVPLLIHLWNRKQVKIIEVGSIRWLKGSSTRSTQRLWLEDWPLLLLRCFILLLFSLLLAGVCWESSTEEEVRKDAYYLVHPQSLQELSRPAIDSLERSGWQLRLLAPGLPLLSDSLRWQQDSIAAVDVWAVMQEADEMEALADTVSIHAPLRQALFSGRRPALHKTYIFREGHSPPSSSVVFAGAFQQDKDIFLQQALSTGEKIRIRKDTLSSEEWSRLRSKNPVDLSAVTELKVSILVDEKYERDGEIMRYAFEVALADDPSRRLLLSTEAEKAAESEVLVYLREGKIPDSLKEEKSLLIRYAEPEENGPAWLRHDFMQADRPVYLLTERVFPQRVSRDKLSRLPQELASLLQPEVQQSISGYLPMPASQAHPLQAGGAADYENGDRQEEEMHEWLWLLLFGLFATERIWVYLK